MDAEKKYVRIEVKKGERVYYFYIEENSPIGEAYDAAYDVLAQLTNYAKEAMEKSRPVKAESKEEAIPAEIVAEEPSNENK
jgi:exonuclease III